MEMAIYSLLCKILQFDSILIFILCSSKAAPMEALLCQKFNIVST